MLMTGWVLSRRPTWQRAQGVRQRWPKSLPRSHSRACSHIGTTYEPRKDRWMDLGLHWAQGVGCESRSEFVQQNWTPQSVRRLAL
jgi:hypothetical protein